MKKVKRKNVKRGRLISILLAAAMTFTLTACGQGNPADGDGKAPVLADADNRGQTQDKTGGSADGQTAMGRYVEEEVDLSEQLGSPAGICVRDDGSIVLLDSSSGFLVSKDGGKTWETETPDWYTKMRADEIWIASIAMSPDGTVCIIYDAVPNDGDYTPALEVIAPDGTQTAVELELTADEMYIRDVTMTDDNRIIASTVSENLYEIYQDGTGELLLRAQIRPYWFRAQGNLLVMDNDAEDDGMPVIYDMESETYIEDDVLSDFVHENYSKRYYNGFYDYTMYTIPSDEQVVYVIGGKGIHRHVVGGNMMEQIVDGSLSVLSNPSYNITSAVRLEGDVFLVLFSNGKLVRFTYDPDVPTVPENVLTIYSLKENDSLRQTIASFQSQNPDIFVSYEIGIEEGSSVTREDAVKKLNTEVMAGAGPDLFVMDGMPLASYAEKGMLLDLTDYLKDYSASEPLFDNVIEALQIDGKSYVAPATVALPKIIYKKEALNGITGLADIADTVEALRKEHPGKDIIGMCSTDSVLKRFVSTSAPLWVSADGTVSRDVIREYLEQCKRIYDAQMDGLDTDVIETYNRMSDYYMRSYGESMAMLDWRLGTDIYDYIGGMAYFVSGWIEDSYSFREAASVDRAEGYEDSGFAPMKGQCTGIFKPETLLGISAASGQIETAKEFMAFFLSAEAGEEYYGLPVNQVAFDRQLAPTAEEAESGVYASSHLSNDDGLDLSYVIYRPSDEQIAQLKEELSTVDTAYLYDQVLEDAVYNQGGAYIRGEQTLDGALDEIGKRVALYMAE